MGTYYLVFLPLNLLATVLTPIEMIKCRMQANKEMASLKGASSSAPRLGPVRLTRSIIANEGPLAPFKGLSAAIVREMVGYFFFFGVYEMVRESLVTPGGTKDDIGERISCKGCRFCVHPQQHFWR